MSDRCQEHEKGYPVTIGVEIVLWTWMANTTDCAMLNGEYKTKVGKYLPIVHKSCGM